LSDSTNRRGALAPIGRGISHPSARSPMRFALWAVAPSGIVSTANRNLGPPLAMSVHTSPAVPFDLSSYVEGWRMRERARQREETEWRARIAARLPQVVRMLAEDFGATRVLLFGSLARGAAEPGSDVDLLVDGLPLELLVAATVRADRLLAEASADLVPADRVRPEVLSRALAEGVLLHGD
jgi:uncharacterized protein